MGVHNEFVQRNTLMYLSSEGGAVHSELSINAEEMSSCIREPSLPRITDRFRNLRKPDSETLEDSGLHKSTVISILDRSHKNPEAAGYIRKTDDKKIKPNLYAGLLFHNVKTRESYVLEKEIGWGNSGIVWSCIHEVTGERFAVKVIRLDVIRNANSSIVNGFLREVRIHDFLRDNDKENKAHIIRFKEVLIGGKNKTYIGGLSSLGHVSLSSIISPIRVLSLDSIFMIMKKVYESLVVLSDLGLTHSDLKAGNILFNQPIKYNKIKPCEQRQALMSSNEWRQRNDRYNTIKGKPCSYDLTVDVLDLVVDSSSEEFGICLVDMGSALHVGIGGRTPCCAYYLRCPEDTYQIGDGSLRDIWSSGLLMFELYTGHKWFPYSKGHYNTEEGWNYFLDPDGLKVVPAHWRRLKRFNRFQESIDSEDIDFINDHFADDPRSQWILQVIKSCLVVDVNERCNAQEMITKYFLEDALIPFPNIK